MLMRTSIRSACFALCTGATMIFAAPAAHAQALNNDTQPARPVNLSMEQRHVIKEIILKDLKVAPVTASVPTNIGDTIPAGVPLQPIPVEVASKVPQMKTHSFIVKDDAVLIVDPNNNTIAEKVE